MGTNSTFDFRTRLQQQQRHIRARQGFRTEVLDILGDHWDDNKWDDNKAIMATIWSALKSWITQASTEMITVGIRAPDREHSTYPNINADQFANTLGREPFRFLLRVED